TLPPGSVVDPDVRPAPGPSAGSAGFGGGSIQVPMDGHLTPAAGTIDLWCRLPKTWPPAEDATLFHAGEEAHVHVTLFFRTGRLLGVYKAGEEHYAAVMHEGARAWQPESWHHLQLAWAAEGEEVLLYLRVDGEPAASVVARQIERWPDRFYLGSRRGRAPWTGLMSAVRLAPQPAAPPELKPGRRTIRVDADVPVGECYNFWSVSNFTSQEMFAEPARWPQIRAAHPYMRYVNCVRLLGGRDDGKNEFFLGVEPNGRVRCNFTPMVAYLKGILDGGWTPCIVLDNVPTAMSDPPQLHTYGNTYPPKDPRVWHQYVEAAVRAMVEAFGRDQVSRWRFRVGTEPDLHPGHWAGTKEDYLRHYDFTVDAVTRVIPNADIGPGNILNPAGYDANATSQRNQWGLEIIDHAARGTNYCTGATGTRLCFFSCSWYGRVGHPSSSFPAAIRAMRQRLDRYPQFRRVPVEVAEFGVLVDDRGRRLWGGDATEWGASWYAEIVDYVYQWNVRRVHEWAQTTAQLPHPRTHVTWMLEQMAGGERVRVSVDGESAARCGAVAARREGALYVLLYNHRPQRRPKVPEEVTLVLRDPRMVPGRRWLVSEWQVDKDHGVFMHAFYRDCEAAGIQAAADAALYDGNIGRRFGTRGFELLAANRAQYTQLATLPQTRKDEPLAVGKGEATLTMEMPGHSVRFLRVEPAQP
ncbi:MAG: hypothetical protein QHJ73_03580, partial [Armatimonadota bacterium]|nr:hypothetical protein [Armatimonadota bacterium]